MYKIFDIHTHTYPEAIAEKAVRNLSAFYDFEGNFNFSAEGKGTYADLESHAADYGVRGFLLFSVATNAHQVQKVNDTIAALVKQSRENGFETVGFAGIHQDYPDFAGEVERVIGLGLKGIKIHPDIQQIDIDAPRMMELCEIIEGRLPLYLHMGDKRPEYRFSQPKKLAHLLDRFPKLEVVAAHLGGYQAWDEAVEMLNGRPNVWYDTSSALWVLTPERATELIHAFGADRVMFGTDYPVKNIDTEMERFLKLGLNEQERQDILYNNAKRFLKI
ncbi:MAG: amidohydrolase family protein [Clostridia bacterium]|nr:amidohydrolase family protein [Clostridia bacterium]